MEMEMPGGKRGLSEVVWQESAISMNGRIHRAVFIVCQCAKCWSLDSTAGCVCLPQPIKKSHGL